MRLFLAALLLTGCATEADRYCPVIRATGVAAPSAQGVGCLAGTMACPAGTTCQPGISSINFCTMPCTRRADCAGYVDSARAVCHLARRVCVLTCEDDGDCPRGTRCIEPTATGTAAPCSSSGACLPRRYCSSLNC